MPPSPTIFCERQHAHTAHSAYGDHELPEWRCLRELLDTQHTAPQTFLNNCITIDNNKPLLESLCWLPRCRKGLRLRSVGPHVYHLARVSVDKLRWGGRGADIALRRSRNDELFHGARASWNHK